MNNLVPGRSASMLLAGFAALALILVALLAACGGDAVTGEDADTEAPAPEATDRVRAPAPGSPATDREILVTLYNALDGPNWEANENWLTDAPMGEWSGVTTDDKGRVTVLVLVSGGLSGEIPAELGNLAGLKHLVLQGLYGKLSGQIPPELGNLTNLVNLSLTHGELSGEIPPELGNLTNLTDLYLHDNRLSGVIPPELVDRDYLYELNLARNQLSGEIPPELINLSPIVLDLSGNQLSGAIPPKWEWSRMLELRLGGNQFNGHIPPELGNFTGLEELSLGNNQLTGEIPPELGNIESLLFLGSTAGTS